MLLTLSDGLIFDTYSKAVEQARAPSKSGVILYEGPSVLDGKPIVAIATFNTKNRKTGDMIQTWILRSDMSPVEAVQKGEDSSICGRCPHRHSLNGGCYVLPFQAPLKVYKHYHGGGYLPEVDSAMFNGRHIRIGSYGDPAAVPVHIWQTLLLFSKGHTAYTHQHNHPAFDDRLLDFCMVSVETEKQAEVVQRDGCKSFRIKKDGDPLMDGEVNCLADSHGINCEKCGLCNAKQVNVAVTAHGRGAEKIIAKFL